MHTEKNKISCRCGWLETHEINLDWAALYNQLSVNRLFLPIMLNKNENLNFTAWASFEEVIGQIDLQQSFERLRSASAERNGLIRRINSFESDSFYNKAVGWKLPEDRKFNWLVEQYEDQVQIEFKLEWEVQQLFEQEYFIYAFILNY